MEQPDEASGTAKNVPLMFLAGRKPGTVTSLGSKREVCAVTQANLAHLQLPGNRKDTG